MRFVLESLKDRLVRPPSSKQFVPDCALSWPKGTEKDSVSHWGTKNLITYWQELGHSSDINNVHIYN